jgi:hypothetical protein
MNRKRLQILKRALLKVADDSGNLQFDLAMWARFPEEYAGRDPVAVVEGALAGANYCGTTACACGIAATIPSFKRDGLGLRPEGNQARIYFGSAVNADAAAEFFEISYELAIWLFEPSRYPKCQRRSPRIVVERIERVLDGLTEPNERRYY